MAAAPCAIFNGETMLLSPMSNLMNLNTGAPAAGKNLKLIDEVLRNESR